MGDAVQMALRLQRALADSIRARILKEGREWGWKNGWWG